MSSDPNKAKGLNLLLLMQDWKDEKWLKSKVEKPENELATNITKAKKTDSQK